MPYCPTRPLLFGTCFTSQSIVSYVSVLSSMAVAPDFVARCGRMLTNSPSDIIRPRTSWYTKMYPSST